MPAATCWPTYRPKGRPCSTPHDWITPAAPPASTKYSASPPSDGVFQQIGGAAYAFGRFCHLGGDLTGLSDALRIKDGTQVCDQRTQVTGREGPPRADFQPGDGIGPDPLIVDR